MAQMVTDRINIALVTLKSGFLGSATNNYTAFRTIFGGNGRHGRIGKN
jgi:hypothetical protein